MAAALRRIAGEKSFMLSSISAKLVAAPSSLFIWQRGITTKLFVGGTLLCSLLLLDDNTFKLDINRFFYGRKHQ
ncbi:hypothetical protein OIU78_002309 [Salix suchowensis]|nr:hypothetical protein OIU78_002309 [Salix suchowensis]